MFAIILPRGDARLLGSLLFQKCRDFHVYLPEGDPVAADFEDRLPLVAGGLEAVQEDFALYLEPGTDLGKNFLKRVRRCIQDHPEHDVYNIAVKDAPKLPRNTTPARLFQAVFLKQVPAPLSAFVIRVSTLREKGVYGADDTLLPLATILNCAQERGIRRVRWERIGWKPSIPPSDPQALEKAVRHKLEFFHWSETFFQDEYPMGASDRMALYAGEIAKLYPSHSPDELKPLMLEFAVSQGPVRKMRATSALKAALKSRQKDLQ